MGELSGFHMRQTFLPVLEPMKSKVKVLSDSVRGESSPFGSQVTAFSPCPHMAERERGLCRGVSSYKDLNVWHQGPTLGSSFNLNHVLAGHVSNTVSHTGGLGLQHQHLEATHFSLQRRFCYNLVSLPVFPTKLFMFLGFLWGLEAAGCFQIQTKAVLSEFSLSRLQTLDGEGHHRLGVLRSRVLPWQSFYSSVSPLFLFGSKWILPFSSLPAG